MAIEEMELLDMTFDKKYLKEVLCQLKETKYFYPQPATKIVNNVKDVFTMTPDEDYKNMLDELEELAEHVKLDTSSVKEGSIHFAKEDYRKALDDVTKEAKQYLDIKEEFERYLMEGMDESEAIDELIASNDNLLDDPQDVGTFVLTVATLAKDNDVASKKVTKMLKALHRNSEYWNDLKENEEDLYEARKDLLRELL